MSDSNKVICSCCNISFVSKKSDFKFDFSCCNNDEEDGITIKNKCINCICIFHHKPWLSNLFGKDFLKFQTLYKGQFVALCCIHRASVINNDQKNESNNTIKKYLIIGIILHIYYMLMFIRNNYYL